LKFFITFFIILFVSACAEKPAGDSYLHSEKAEAPAQDQASVTSEKKSPKYLAYTHVLAVELEEEKLGLAHKLITSACEQDLKYDCAILNDDYTSGEYSSGRIKLRVKPEGAKFFLSLASQEGEVATQSREAEDLTLSILDTAKRIEQLERFEKKLIALESRADADIDSLLKVASQLAETQTQLEYLQGSKATLLQRVQTDILNINLRLKYNDSFVNSMGEAFSNFGEEFTYAIEGLIGAIAYIVPWTIFLLLMFFVVRASFRFLNGKVFRGKRRGNDNVS